MSRLTRKLMLPLILLVALVLSGCGGPPQKLSDAAKAALTGISDARKANDTARTAYAAQLKQPKYGFMTGYSPAQLHVDHFDQAKAKLDEAQKAYDGQVKPILDNYEDSKQAQLESAIGSVSLLTKQAREITADPPKWADKVVATRANPDGTVRLAVSTAQNISVVYTPLSSDVDAAKKKYASNADAITKRFQPMVTQQSTALLAAAQLQAEARKTPPNYADMTTYATTVQTNASAFRTDSDVFRAQLAKLDVRETRTLLDIRVDSKLIVTRVTWDENSDSGNENQYDYPPIPVDQDTVAYFAGLASDATLAEDYDGFLSSGLSVKIDKNQWNKLHIDTRKPKWADGDNAAGFYVGGIDDTYCNKLRVLKDGNPDISGRAAAGPCSKYDVQSDLDQGIYWAESETFDADSIGMDTYAKGWGDFEDQADTAASPPGMVYVGDPATGQWQQDSSGNSFWSFYGRYAFYRDLIGGPHPYYYQSEYRDWHSNYRYSHRPYYGSTNGHPRFGLSSPMAQTRFPNFKFRTSKLPGAALRSSDSHVRGGSFGGGGK